MSNRLVSVCPCCSENEPKKCPSCHDGNIKKVDFVENMFFMVVQIIHFVLILTKHVTIAKRL